MISFFPDVNVWVALAVEGHAHNQVAWNWLNGIPDDRQLLFARFTQLGMSRLLTNSAAMGLEALTIQQSWDVFDRFLADPRVEFRPEPEGLSVAFRKATMPLGQKPASKWIGDCFLLAYAEATQSTLVTFDQALLAFSRQHGYSALPRSEPGPPLLN